MRVIIWSLNLILWFSISCLSFPYLAQADSGLNIFRSAYDNRYTWNLDFPGYTGEVVVTYADKSFSGQVKVNADLSVEVMGIADENIREYVENTLKMEVIHRRRVDFDRIHGGKDFEIEAQEADGVVVIKELGDEQDSFYRVQNRRIVQVNRTFEDNVSVTVDTLSTTPIPEGYLASQFKTVFRNAKTQAVEEIETVSDRHEKVGNYYLLAERKIESVDPEQKPMQIEIRFQNLQLAKRIK